MKTRGLIFFIVVGFLSLSTSGCWKVEESDDEINPVIADTTAPDFADQYLVEDLNCQTTNGVASIDHLSYFEFDGAKSVQKEKNASGLESTSSFSTVQTSLSLYGLHQRSDCTYSSGEVSCAEKADLIHPALPLRLCRQNAVYARTSIEGVAVASSVSIDRASEFYLSIEGHVSTIAKSELIVLPKIEELYTVVGGASNGMKVSLFMTDNLAYVPNFGNSPAFVIYGKSKKSVEAGRWTGVNLWEIPFTLAHEFGHHVFRTHTKIEDAPKESSISLAENLVHTLGHAPHLPILPIRKEIASQLPEYAKENSDSEKNQPQLVDGDIVTSQAISLQRTVTSRDRWSAVNEGYADLFAFYFLGAPSDSLANIDCFAKSRDVSSDVFAGGISKALTSSVLETYESRIVVDSPSGCDRPDWQEPHTIGAVVAHGVNKIFAASLKDPSALQRARLLLKWGDSLGDLARAATEASLTLEALLRQSLVVAAAERGAGNALSNAVCDEARKEFPAFANIWFEGAQAVFKCAQ